MYHLHLKTGSRNKGQSATAKSDYICREHKYSRQEDICLYTESGNMPEFAKENPRDYWEAADDFERANGRLFVEIEFALPNELSPVDQCHLASIFAATVTNERDLPYTLAVHEGRGHNPHAHLMISERANDGIDREPDRWFSRANSQEPELGGAAKDRGLQAKEWLLEVREGWAKEANQFLESRGCEQRLDHRSLQEQGIDREPQQHVGPAAWNMADEGIDTERMEEYRKQQEEQERERQLAEERAAVEQDITDVQLKIDHDEEQEEKKKERSQSQDWGW